MPTRPARATALAVVLSASALATSACGPQQTPLDGGNDGGTTGTQIFRLAVNGAPGGAFLSASYVHDIGGGYSMGARAFLVGGYVGVDPAMVTDGAVGRLVEYVRPGMLTTRCTTDQVLWWVDTYVDPTTNALTVFAVGEGGRVLRYRGGQCETLDTGLTYERGAPTFWGVKLLSADDAWIVGGSASPTGPTGVLVHYDGTAFHQESAVPADAQGVNLYKVDATRDTDPRRLYVVGASGVILRRVLPNGAWERLSSDVRTQDNRLFTVSCAGVCTAVGGAGTGIVLRNTFTDDTPWQSLTTIGTTDATELPGLNGVWTDPSVGTFIVGTGGFTLHTINTLSYVPPTSLTSATLHCVTGAHPPGGLAIGGVMAVGGELGVTDVSQRAVVLIRGDDAPTFSFDGHSYASTGDLRPSLGGAGQGGGSR